MRGFEAGIEAAVAAIWSTHCFCFASNAIPLNARSPARRTDQRIWNWVKAVVLPLEQRS